MPEDDAGAGRHLLEGRGGAEVAPGGRLAASGAERREDQGQPPRPRRDQPSSPLSSTTSMRRFVSIGPGTVCSTPDGQVISIRSTLAAPPSPK